MAIGKSFTNGLMICALIGSVSAPAVPPRYYTPQELAQRVARGEQFHPQEKPRGKCFFEALRYAGKNVSANVKVSGLFNGVARVPKGFHEHEIAVSRIVMKLDPQKIKDLPPEYQHGLLDPKLAGVDYDGVITLTTGRATSAPLHLKPDVTGASMGVFIDGKWVPFSMTGSKGAFASTGANFSKLGGFAAYWGKLFGFASEKEIEENYQALKKDGGRSYDFNDHQPNFIRKILASAGMALGEGFFVARHPIAGLGTLLPAILTGRRSPLLGYYDIGFGSGHALLATENVPLAERRAFRYGIRLADNADNRRLREETPGWLQTLRNAIKNPYHYLSDEFQRWHQQQDIVYELYIVPEDVANPSNTSIEKTHQRWHNEKIVIGTVTLPKPTRADENYTLRELVRPMPFHPGFGFHIPVGDLALTRSVGESRPTDRGGKPGEPSDQGAYWRSGQLREAAGIPDPSRPFGAGSPDFAKSQLDKQMKAILDYIELSKGGKAN